METLRLRHDGIGWEGGQGDYPVVSISVGTWISRIAVTGDTKEHALNLARDIIEGLSKLQVQEVVFTQKYEECKGL